MDGFWISGNARNEYLMAARDRVTLSRKCWGRGEEGGGYHVVNHCPYSLSYRTSHLDELCQRIHFFVEDDTAGKERRTFIVHEIDLNMKR